MLHQGLLQGFFKACLAAQLLFQQGNAGDSGVFRPLQGIGSGRIGNHQGNGAAVEGSCLLGIYQRLQIGSAAGNQHGNPGAHFKITFSSPWAMVPIT